MSIKTKLAALAVAALAVTGSVASTATPVEAHSFHNGGFRHGFGIGAGLLGAAVVGSAIAANNSYPDDDGYRGCGWVRRFDAFGNYGRVRSCY
jgi:hypothetical protein